MYIINTTFDGLGCLLCVSTKASELIRGETVCMCQFFAEEESEKKTQLVLEYRYCKKNEELNNFK